MLKICTYYFFDNIINTKNLDPNKTKIDEKSYKNIFTYYKTTNIWKPLYIIINKVNEYIEESNENKYLKLFPANESKNTLKGNGKLWDKIRDLLEQQPVT